MLSNAWVSYLLCGCYAASLVLLQQALVLRAVVVSKQQPVHHVVKIHHLQQHNTCVTHLTSRT